jgi:glycosyltransferase involved in cell wall biosynthesis
MNTHPPLVTGIMVTGNRPEFVRQSLRYFRRQTYPNRELVIVDDGDQPLDVQNTGEQVRYHRIRQGLSIGEKRNIACSFARGEAIIHWDDDDWYAPDRIAEQVRPIFAGRADITALSMSLVLELDRMRFWRCSPAVHVRMFVGNVHGGTLAYTRRYLDQGVRFRPLSLSEDAYFLFDAKRRGGKLSKLSGDGLFVYVRHGANAWSFACGEHIDPEGWTSESAPEYLLDDLLFYQALSQERSLPVVTV